MNWGGRHLSIFARATVCNLFFVAKLWYLLQVLSCSRFCIQKIHRVFAVFVWASTWERTSRTNLFRRVRYGGLSLCHLFIRQVVNRFLFLRDQIDPFLRTVIQVHLCGALPDFVVSTCDGQSGPLSAYLKEVAGAYRFLAVRFSLEYLSSVSRKRLTKDLVELSFSPPLYRALYSSLPGQDVLCRVKKMLIPPNMKTFFFNLHAGTLPVKTWLEEKDIFVPWTVNCLLCKQPESIEHVFLDCWDAVFYWDVLQRTLKKELPLTAHGIRYLPVEKTDSVPYDLIMVIGLHSLWKSRMAVRHADIDMRPACHYFTLSINQLLKMYSFFGETPDWLPVLEGLVSLRSVW
uniref:Reverse transcriptase zinc-binding domain-containing protein n=1 Tax=Ixodes ricinus TaxID=34613 RepID=V5H7W5_IXORI